MRQYLKLPASVVVFASLMSACQQSEPYARAFQMTDRSQGVGGPKAIARSGDFILENDRIKIGVLGARASLGPHTSGGSIVDADLNRADPRYTSGHGRDQLAEIFSTVNLNVTSADELTAPDDETPGEVVILADGSDGGAAVVCVEGPELSFITLLDLLWGLPDVGPDDDYRIKTHYILEPGSPALLVRSWAVFSDEEGCSAEVSDEPLPGQDESLPIIDWGLLGGVAMGDFYLQGGDVDVFAPGIGFDETGYLYEESLTGRNTFFDPIPTDFLAGVAEGVSYGLMPDTGKMFVPMFTSSQTVGIGAGISPEDLAASDVSAFSYDRWFAIGHGDVGSVVDSLLEARGDAFGRVQGYVVEEGTGVALSDVHVFVREPGAELPWSEWTTDVGDDPDPDGSFGGMLPPGEWEIFTYAKGRPMGEVATITVTEGATLDLVLGSPQPGSVRFEVTDQTGRSVPAKVTFFTADGAEVRNPDLGDSFIAGSPAEVVFAPYGHGQIVLPDGTYTAVASRGIEYELDISDTFHVDAGRAVDLELVVQQSIDTTGWITADFHVHAQASHDSGVSQAERIGTMTSEGVEYFAGTDHDSISYYAPVVEAMGLEEWVQTSVGVETTTIEVGHFLGWPLMWDESKDNGGALDWTGLNPEEMVTGVKQLGVPGGIEPIVFVGHPRDGILGYFDQFGFNPYQGEVGEPVVDTMLGGFLANPNELLVDDNFYTGVEALEILNGKRMEIIRTPTQAEMDAYAADGDTSIIYDWASRTLEEQAAIEDGTMTLGYGHEGTLDDWFSMLNLGYRYTLLGNSDTHGKTGTESGCPRNYVVSDTDEPGMISEAAIAQAVREGRVVASYGPFIRFYVDNELNGPGSEIVRSGEIPLTIEIESVSWIDVDRVELYENGTLIEEWSIEVPNVNILNFAETVSVSPEVDSHYVVVALGPGDLGPVFTTVEIPPVQLEDIVGDALAGVPAVSALLGDPIPIPRAFPVLPYAVTNPIFVDLDGDGWDAPGLPDWLVEPTEPEGGE